MPDIPEPTPTPVPEPVVPQVVVRKRHRLIIIISLVVVAILILAGAGVMLFSLWRSNQTGSPVIPPGILPGSQTTVLPSATPDTVVNQTPQALPDRSAQLAQQQNNIVVIIQYNQKPQFQLKVMSVERSYQEDNNNLYAPITGSPYSVLKVYDDKNNVLVERPFSVTTAVLAESFGQNISGEVAVESSVAILQMKLPENAIPQKVEILSGTGQILDSRTFVWEQLPLRFEVRPPTPTPL